MAQTSTTQPGAAPPQREVKVAVSVLDPFVIKRADGSFGGFSVELWEEIARRNNYRTVYVEKSDAGAEIDAVDRGEAEVAIGPVTVTAERADRVEFSPPTLSSGLQMMVATGKASALDGLWRALLDPAVLVLICLMVATALAAAVVIWLLERQSNPEFAHKAPKGIAEGGWWASVTMLTIGYGDRVPRTGLGRSFTVVWMVIGMLLVAAVTATYTSNLTVRRLTTNVESPDDLRDHSVVSVTGSSAAAYLTDKGISFRGVASPSQMIDAVRDGSSEVAVYERPVLARATRKSDGNLALAGAQFTHDYDAIAIAKGSDLRAPLDRTLLRIYEDGTYDQVFRSWFQI